MILPAYDLTTTSTTASRLDLLAGLEGPRS